MLVDALFDDLPKLPGLNARELVASMQQLVPDGCTVDVVSVLLKEYVASVMPFLTYEWHLSHGPALYCLVRLVRPDLVVETGVREGESTVSILAAMAENRHGMLISCDVDLPTARTFRFLNPDGDLPRLGARVGVLSKLDSPHAGLFVPRSRVPVGGYAWRFEQCKGTALLEGLLTPPRMADVFFHDSDHGYANQKAEYDLAWKLVRPGGWVGGDDVEWDKPPWAFHELCTETKLKPSLFGKGRMLRKPGA